MGGLEDDLHAHVEQVAASAAARDTGQREREDQERHDAALSRKRVAEFIDLMTKHHCVPDPIYRVAIRIVQHSKGTGLFGGKARPTVKEHRVTPFAEAWIFQVYTSDYDYGEEPGLAITKAGQIVKFKPYSLPSGYGIGGVPDVARQTEHSLIGIQPASPGYFGDGNDGAQVPYHHRWYDGDYHDAMSFGPRSGEPELVVEDPGSRFAKEHEYSKLVDAAARYRGLV